MYFLIFVNQKGLKMISEQKTIPLKDGVNLHADIAENGTQIWIIVTHGLGEHSGRHHYIHKFFSQYFNICFYDLRGHGKSEGKRGHINKFSQFTSDLEDVISYLQQEYAMKRYVLFGHSMGGLITASFMQNKVSQNFYPEKVFLSAPASAAAGGLGKVFNLAPLKFMSTLASIPGSVPIGGILDLTKLSHDPRVFESYVTDELNILKIHTKLFFELLYEARRVFSRPLRISCDLFCATGTADEIVGCEHTINYFQNIEKNAKLKIIEGGYHELHNEINKYSSEYFDFLKDSIMYNQI